MKSQETFPVYSDYLSDNVCLVHPAAAGIENCKKIRLTRSQWTGIEDAPLLQTLSAHTRIGESMGVGLILFNVDFGAVYHIGGFYSYFIAKNMMLTARNLYDDKYESLNLRGYLVTLGIIMDKGKVCNWSFHHGADD